MDSKIHLICFDLNKTLIKENTWYNLNLELGVKKEEDKIWLNKYKKGQISYLEWQKKIEDRYKKSEKATKKNIEKIIYNYNYKKGVKIIIDYLKKKKYKLALISGSINILLNKVKQDLGFDYAEANNSFLFDKNGKFKEINVFEDEETAKLIFLKKICLIEKIRLENCCCIGDGDNETAIFNETKKGITFKNSKIEHLAWKKINNLLDLKKIL